MAAKQQGKKKARVPKRKNIHKKNQKGRRNWKKLQARRHKKQQPRLKRQVKRTSTTKSGIRGQPRKICSSKLFAAKILRQLPKVRMEAKARILMKTLLVHLYNYVTTQLEALRQKEEQALFSCNNVQAALNEAIEKELTKHMGEQPTIVTATT